MKKIISLICVLGLVISIGGCTGNDTQTKKYLEAGDPLEISGMVSYSDHPSDIGQEYCIIEGDVEFDYYFIDVYNEKSQLSGSTFYTKKEQDTALLKDYVGQEVTISGFFASESHGVPYITDISIIKD